MTTSCLGDPGSNIPSIADTGATNVNALGVGDGDGRVMEMDKEGRRVPVGVTEPEEDADSSDSV